MKDCRLTMLALLALLAPVALGACKDKQENASAPAARAPSAASRSTPPPSLPATPSPAAGKAAEANEAAPAGPPLSVEEASPLVPAIEGTPVIALKQTSDHQQVHGTWCIDGTSADDVARQVSGWLAAAGYTDLSTRGDARKAGVAGDKGGFRFSMIVSASAAAVCRAPAHYFASATIYRN